MRAYAIVGRPKAGKTTFTKGMVQRIAHPKPPLVFDTNNEWNTGAPLPEIDAFLDHANKTPGRVVVIEDATVFFHTTGHSEKLKRLLVTRRHTRTTVVLLFHSLRQVPLYILELLDAVVVFATNDNAERVAKRWEAFPEVAEAVIEVRERLNSGEAFPYVHVPLT